MYEVEKGGTKYGKKKKWAFKKEQKRIKKKGSNRKKIIEYG